jgi:site-specific DNA recombinase
VSDLSRLARNLEELLRQSKILKHRNIFIYVASTGLDSRSASFQLVAAVQGMLDEQFVEGIRDKSRRGSIGSIERGHIPGGKCHGYRNVPIEDPNRKGVHGRNAVVGVYQEILPEEAEIVPRIFQMYAEGYSYERIAKQLNREGVLSPQPSRNGCVRSWGYTRIREMLFNERYRGRVIWGRTTTVKDLETGRTEVRKVPPSEWIIKDNEKVRIISEELWAAVREQNPRMTKKVSCAANGGMNRTAASRTYLFSGCLQCGLCNASIVIIAKSGDHAIYGCPYHRHRGVCKNNLKIDRRRLEDQLLGKLVASLRAPEYAELIAQEFERQLKAAQKAETSAKTEAEANRDELLRERATLSKNVANLADAIAEHGLSVMLSTQLSQAEKRIELIDGLLKPKAKSERPSATPEQIREFLTRRMEQLVEVLLGDPEKAKRELSTRIDKLILTPQAHDGRNLLVVTGDLRLFADDDALPFNSGDGLGELGKLIRNGEHYEPPPQIVDYGLRRKRQPLRGHRVSYFCFSSADR